ncbi:MAG: exodeoxyribonuclease VII large subunit, partial [Burkholderiales bacterium]
MNVGFETPDRASTREIVTVGQLNRAVAGLLERSFPLVWVSGEISNLTRAASGHWYFSLKDATASVRAVMFRGRNQHVPFVPANGDRVEVRAQVSLYEARGDFQLNVEQMREAGAGDLFQQFLRLKARLEAEGLFDEDRKRPIPPAPRCVGVVTSPQAAALRDVLTTLARRAPQVPVVLYPASVQGAQAPGELVRAVKAAGARGECDVLLLVRGGGSIEDLWAFNDEGLARAIAACPIPVISGVGHETDFTIADFVADLRAPTPTGAATRAVPDVGELRGALERDRRRLVLAWQRRLEQAEQRLDLATR